MRPLLTGSPVGHFMGMLGGLFAPLCLGTSVHLLDAWQPADVLDALIAGDLAMGGGSTYLLTSLLDAPEWGPQHLDHVRHVGLGGAPVPAAVAERATAMGISLTRAYGSTEHPSTTGSAPGDPARKRLYTDGAALGGVEVRLLDDDGREVPRGTAGEVHSRGPDLCVGYTDRALTTAAFDADGWYATGDVAVMDDEGSIRIVDRKRDIIIRGGENVSAAEVEDILLRYPGVAEAAVIAAPDDRMGERVCAFVRPLAGAASPELDAVRAHFRAAGLARQKWPEELRVVGDLPRTPSGKVKKHVLRQQVREAT
jgi:acyl-CoA synthetase (AMP-forming)/AMP-acid ligase II